MELSTTIKGKNNWELKVFGIERSPGKEKYTFNLWGTFPIKEVLEDNYEESENFFYALVHEKPTIYHYVGKMEGGAIPFRGKGRWSGNSGGLGLNLNKKFMGAYINRRSCFAIPLDEAKKILKDNFPGKFKIAKTHEDDIYYITQTRLLKKDIEQKR